MIADDRIGLGDADQCSADGLANRYTGAFRLVRK
jgi:hypothetical protein